MIKLMRRLIDPEHMDILYQRPFSAASLADDFVVKGGQWTIQDGWLTGKNPDNSPGMIVLKQPFYGNVMLEFEARTVLPCTHDINVMWNGSWDEVSDCRGVAYVAGIQGWWDGKVGFEKSPDYALNVGTQLFPFEPGRTYRVQVGSADGHVFVVIDGVLILEVTDPDPINTDQFGMVGFEAYCSYIQFRHFKIRRVTWEERETAYTPEF